MSTSSVSRTPETMFVEIIEQLRCPAPHAVSHLVASATATEARHIVEGVLGCPTCGAEYPINDGVAKFATGTRPAHPDVLDDTVGLRLAAFLVLTDARGFALLCGRWGSAAAHVAKLTETPLVLVNPPPGLDADVAGRILVGDVAPFMPSSVRALALDELCSPALVTSLAATVRAGGRVVGPDDLPVPSGIREMARDSQFWVGEKTTAPESAPRVVSLHRAKR